MSEIVLPLTPPPLEALAIPKAVMPVFSSFYIMAAIAIMIAIAALLYVMKGKIKLIPLVLIMCFFLFSTPVLAYDWENPIDTTNIGLFAYYFNPSGWNLPTIASAFYSYTNHGLYYDGIVRIYYGVDGTTWTGTSTDYASVNIRVRQDGWIVAFFNYTQDAKFIPFYTWCMRTSYFTGSTAFSAYQTSLARAIWRFLYVSGQPLPFTSTTTVKSTSTSKTTTTTCKTSETTTTACTTTCTTTLSTTTTCTTVTSTSTTTTLSSLTSTNWIGYASIGYYDYHYPTATRLMLIQGYDHFDGVGYVYRKYFFIIPQGTVRHAVVIGYSWQWCYGYADTLGIYFDATSCMTSGSRELFASYDVSALCSVATTHQVFHYDTGGGHTEIDDFCAVVIVWAS